MIWLTIGNHDFDNGIDGLFAHYRMQVLNFCRKFMILKYSWKWPSSTLNAALGPAVPECRPRSRTFFDKLRETRKIPGNPKNYGVPWRNTYPNW